MVVQRSCSMVSILRAAQHDDGIGNHIDAFKLYMCRASFSIIQIRERPYLVGVLISELLKAFKMM